MVMVVVVIAMVAMTAVATIVMSVRAATMIPSATVQLPATRALMPGRCTVGITRARTFPVTGAPVVTMAVPVPEARGPNVTRTRRRDRFITRRRRRADANGHAHLSVSRCYGKAAERGSNERDGQRQFFHFRPLASDVLVHLHRTRGRVGYEANSRKKMLKLFRFVPREAA